jgi:hypothetical protein
MGMTQGKKDAKSCVPFSDLSEYSGDYYSGYLLGYSSVCKPGTHVSPSRFPFAFKCKDSVWEPRDEYVPEEDDRAQEDDNYDGRVHPRLEYPKVA